ncbi:MAG: PEP-CTERM sorting domain-containing protein, partial [Verrucomicrobia bacterium]|nr:PEP-CTERM sorting domain-containing protein [Verrucomicrobiota bacterium]
LPAGFSRRGFRRPTSGTADTIEFNCSALCARTDATAAPTGATDFYTIALHEIGHALGLNLSFNQWTEHVAGSTFTGSNALAAYNSDNGTSLTSLDMASGSNLHWKEDAYESFIFSAGTPNLAGTVGSGVLQDTLMDPSADFTASIRRLELTNVDVAALQDLGWSVVPEPSTGLMLGAGALCLGLQRRRPR